MRRRRVRNGKREAILEEAPQTATATAFSGSVLVILPVTSGTSVLTRVFGAHPAETAVR